MTTSDMFPPHKASLHLTHNDHKTIYRTVEEWISDRASMMGLSDEDWVSLEQKQKAIDTNELWELQWYPDTPVGFHYIVAADLEAILEYVRQFNGEGEEASWVQPHEVHPERRS